MTTKKGLEVLGALGLLLVIFVLSACDSGNPAGPGDGDLDSDSEGALVCMTDSDCAAGQCCHGSACVSCDAIPCYPPDDACQQDTDCNAAEYCTDSCTCEGEPNGDADGDSSESDESIDKSCEFAPCISWKPTSLEFPLVQYGESGMRTLTIFNDGAEDLKLLDIQIAVDGDGGFGFDTETAALIAAGVITIKPGANQVLGITFTREGPGQKQSRLLITSNDERGTKYTKPEIDLIAAVKGNTEINVTPVNDNGQPYHDFGAVDIGSEQGLDVVITCLPYNTIPEESNAVCTINNLSLDPANGAFYLPNTISLPRYLKFNESLNVTVKFNPLQAGIATAKLSIDHDSDYSPYNPTDPVEVQLVGEGVEPCLTLIPTPPEPLNCGDVTVGVTVSITVKMKSTCGGTVVVNKIWWQGGNDPAAFDLGGLGSQDPQNLNIRIPPGSEVEFMVNCTPPSLGPHAAYLEIHSNDTQHSLQILPVQVIGVNAQIRVTPPSMDFEQVLVGMKDETVVRVENIGTGNVRIYDILIDKRLDGDNNPIATDRPEVFRLSDADEAFIPMDLPGINNPDGEDNFYDFTFEYNPDTEAPTQVDWARAVVVNDSSSPEISITMRGEPVAPHVEWWIVEEGYEDSLFTDEVNFGDTNMGTTMSRNMRVKNVGEATLDCSISFGQNTSADFGVIQVDLAGLDANEYRDVPMSYMPSLPYPGPDSGTLIMQCNDRDHSNESIALKGNGVDPRFYVEPNTSISNPWVFGPLYLYDMSVPKQVKIYNSGSGVLNISEWDYYQIGLEGSWIVENWSMEFPVSLRPHSTNPSDELTFTVQYTPNGVKPSQKMSLRFSTNSIDGSTRYVYFSGSGKDCDPCWYDLSSEEAGCEYQCHMPVGSSCGDTGVEICDGYDNDCNGNIDDPWPIGEACEGLGECGAGTYICATKTTVKCSSEQLPPSGQIQLEKCDGMDNDCDGTTDEDYEIGVPCAVGVGICSVGAWQCLPEDDPGYPFGRRCSAWDMAQTEKCDYIDNDCDGKTDNGTFVNTLAPGNPPCTNCVGVQCDAAGECDWGFYRCGYGVGPNSEPVGTWIECFSPGVGDPEICDGLDNNCNSDTDENFPELGTPCDGEGECGDGIYECSPFTVYETICTTENPYNVEYEGQDETCNFKDDDCDGMTDEDFNVNGECYAPGVCGQVAGKWECDAATGVRRCSTAPGGTQHHLVPGALAQEGPSWGKCDNLDNDCDGTVDEGYGLGIQCDGVGACGVGIIVCTSDGYETQCSTDPGGPDYNPKTELCNGLDDDCNNVADDKPFPDKNGNLHNVGEVCSGVGECDGGHYECANLNQVRCNSLPGGTQYTGGQDVCDGLDNDCDACTDQGYINYEGNCTPIPCTGVGECGAGHYQCIPESHPDYPDVYAKMCDTMPYGDNDQSGPEECDGLDNDCDRSIDEDFETCCDVSNCGACNHACNVPNGTPGCANYECTIASCATGWYDVNGIVDNDGCECYVDQNELQGLGNACGTGSIKPSKEYLCDIDSEAVTVTGNVVPIGDVDWYTFVAVDGAEDTGTGCDEFYASVRFTSNPGGQYAFQVYKNTCAAGNAACPEDQRDNFSFRTDMREDTPGTCGTWDPQVAGVEYDPNPTCYKGHCPCDPIDAPVNVHEGRNYCYLEDVRFYVKVYRREGYNDNATCEPYVLEFSNGVYSTN